MIPLLVLLSAVSAANPARGAGDRVKFALAGQVLQADEKPFPRGVIPAVFLQGATTPFSVRTEAHADGKFKFKKVSPGLYILIAAVPAAGEVRRSIEIGPSVADARGSVSVRIVFDRSAVIERPHDVSAAELSVPDGAWKLYDKAQGRLGRRDLDGAIALLQKAVETAPRFAMAWNHLGTIAYQTRRYADAERYFREALKQDGTAYSPLVNLGATLLATERAGEALPLNERAVRRRPDDALAHVQLGRNYLALGQPDDAERQLREAKALDPAHFSMPQLTLVAIYGARQDIAGVVRELQEFLKYHPDSPAAPAMRRSLEANIRRLNQR